MNAQPQPQLLEETIRQTVISELTGKDIIRAIRTLPEADLGIIDMELTLNKALASGNMKFHEYGSSMPLCVAYPLASVLVNFITRHINLSVGNALNEHYEKQAKIEDERQSQDPHEAMADAYPFGDGYPFGGHRPQQEPQKGYPHLPEGNKITGPIPTAFQTKKRYRTKPYGTPVTIYEEIGGKLIGVIRFDSGFPAVCVWDKETLIADGSIPDSCINLEEY